MTTTPSGDFDADPRERQVRRLAELCTDFDAAIDKLPPEKAEEYRRQQHDVADCRRRAASSRRLLDMRLD